MVKHPTCHATPLDDGVLLALAGKIDYSNATDLYAQLAHHLAQHPERLILDLTKLTHMDSSGVATLIRAMQQQRDRGAKLILCNLTAPVRGIFQIARLDAIFTIVPDTETAKTA